jgi:hypothetical protein
VPQSIVFPLREQQAADFLGVSISTLRRWRWTKRGPRHFRVDNLIRYRLADLDRFVDQHSKVA